MIRCPGFISGRRTCGSSTYGRSKPCRTCRVPTRSSNGLIGTVRRECLDRLLFWSTADLDQKLVEFQRYYNEHRAHAARAGHPPAPCQNAVGAARVSLRVYRWQPHCRGLFQTPTARSFGDFELMSSCQDLKLQGRSIRSEERSVNRSEIAHRLHRRQPIGKPR